MSAAAVAKAAAAASLSKRAKSPNQDSGNADNSQREALAGETTGAPYGGDSRSNPGNGWYRREPGSRRRINVADRPGGRR
jgi:hypothetical protein